MARTPESAAVDFAESSLFTGRFSILALAACGVGFSLSGRLPAAIFSLAAAAVAAAARLWARHVLDGVNAALQAERSCVFPGEPCPSGPTVPSAGYPSVSAQSRMVSSSACHASWFSFSSSFRSPPRVAIIA